MQTCGCADVQMRHLVIVIVDFRANTGHLNIRTFSYLLIDLNIVVFYPQCCKSGHNFVNLSISAFAKISAVDYFL
jgi:hypothetical protein